LGSLPADIKALLLEHGALLLCVQVHTHVFVCKMDDLQLDCELQTALAKNYVTASRCKSCFFVCNKIAVTVSKHFMLLVSC